MEVSTQLCASASLSQGIELSVSSCAAMSRKEIRVTCGCSYFWIVWNIENVTVFVVTSKSKSIISVIIQNPLLHH
jgi:hypothetical protein